MEKIYKENNELVIELRIPFKTRRSNPYDESVNDEMDAIVGVIAGDELSFANWIDMDYKDKDDQISVSFYTYQNTKEDFKKLCKELGIEIYEYPICSRCLKPIYGSFTIGKNGNLCFDCEKYTKK